jgi:signal transduction histidine kinase
MDPKEFQRQSRKILMALGRALTDVSLYKKGHPTPTQSLRELALQLQTVMDGGELTLFHDGVQFLVNGVSIAKDADVPAAVRTFFDRYKVSSLTFLPGLEPLEVEVLHELAELKDPGAEFDIKAFLASKAAPHVVANQITYAVVEEGEVVAAEDKVGEGGDAEASFTENLGQQTIEGAIKALVQKAIGDPELQAKAFEMVMSTWRADLARRIDEATRAIKAEKKVAENERVRAENVIDQIAEGAVTVDSSGRVLMMDPSAEELSGQKMKDLAGKQLGEAVRQEEQILSLSKELEVPSDKDATGAVDIMGDNKLVKDLRASNVVVRDQKGRVVGFMMTLPAAAKFRELERMQQEFVASITHELRAPLTSILSALSILEGQLHATLSKDQDRVLGLASKNANRLIDLVAEILDFQRIQTGHMTVHPATAQVEHFVSEATDGLKPWGQTRGIEITWEVAPGLPPVLADHRRTVQVLTNLISNAIKFTPTGGKIWVTAKKGAGDLQGFVVFSVKDTGRGIAKEDQERIFDKFVQIAASAGKRFPGTGLGLPIAKYLVYLQKGKMWVESEVGKGAAFLFTLPMDIPPLSTTTSGGVSKPVPAPPPPKKPWWKFW